MSQQHKIGKHATTIRNEAGIISVVYHNTEVVKATPDKIILNTGGWFTNTTKTRMNQTSAEFGLGYHVFQKDHVWYAEYNGRTPQFVNDVLILKR